MTFVHGDHLGSTNVTTNTNGVVQEVLEYAPFGEIKRHDASSSNTSLAKQQFTGKKLDDETGLYYYGARYYDPLLGKFITPDTIVQAPSNPQTLNRYAYCNNNPINNVDPSGHSWKKWLSKAVAFIAAAVTFVATIGNPGAAAAVFMAFNITDTVVGGIQSLASGANPGMVFGSMGLSIGLNMLVPDFASSKLLFQVGVNAVRGAAISVATTAAMTGGRGNLGESAAWGGGAGGLSGFLSSEQFTNMEWGDGFRSDSTVRAENATVAKLDAMRTNQMDNLTPEGHSVLTIRARELGHKNSAIDKMWNKYAVGKKHYFGETDMGSFTELDTYRGAGGQRNTFLNGSIFDMSRDTQSALGTNDALISTTMVHGSVMTRAARVWQMRQEGGKYSIGLCDCRGYQNYLRRRGTVY